MSVFVCLHKSLKFLKYEQANVIVTLPSAEILFAWNSLPESQGVIFREYSRQTSVTIHYFP